MRSWEVTPVSSAQLHADAKSITVRSPARFEKYLRNHTRSVHRAELEVHSIAGYRTFGNIAISLVFQEGCRTFSGCAGSVFFALATKISILQIMP
jgi:hypothetical protein